MAVHNKVPQNFRLCTSDWRGDKDFWKTEAWWEKAECVVTKCGQAPSGKSEPEEEKDHLIGDAKHF